MANAGRTGIKLALGVTGLMVAGAAAGYALYKQSSHHASLSSLLTATGIKSADDTSPSKPPPSGKCKGAGRGVTVPGAMELKSDGTLSASDVHRLLEILSSPPEPAAGPMPGAYGTLVSLADRLHIRLGATTLNGNLTYAILSQLTIPDVCRLATVNKSYHSYTTALLHHHEYLRSCARAGFVDGANGRARGQCWRIVSCASDTAKRLEAAAIAGVGPGAAVLAHSTKEGEHKSFYQRLVDRKSVDEENVLKDVHRTLIHYSSFATEEEAHHVLANVLLAYASHDPEVGYCQGMNFVAAFLLTKMNEEDAYWALYTVMTRPQYRLRLFYLPDLSGLLVAKHQFKSLFETHLPALYAHFLANDVYSDMHTEWFMTLFTATATPRETSARIWDLFLVEGYCIIHRVALAILYRSQSILLTMDFEGIIHHLKVAERDKDLMNPDALMAACDMFSSITPQLLARLERQFIRSKLAEQGIDV